MHKAEYIVRFVLSPAEVSKLSHFVKPRAVRPVDVTADVEASEDEFVKVIRQHTRLYLRVWALCSVSNIALRARGSPASVPSARIAGTLALTAAVYRGLYQGINRAVPANSDRRRAMAAAIAALAASIVFNRLPSSLAKGYASLFLATKVVEWLYNYADDAGFLNWKPRLFGAWFLFPFAMGQLFYVLLDSPEQTPNSFKRIMLRLSGSFHPVKPSAFPVSEHWPTDDEWLGSLAEVARLRFPKFWSDMVYRGVGPLPPTLVTVEPILAGANPAHTSYTGALLYPETTSLFVTLMETLVANFKTSGSLIAPLYLAINALRAAKDKTLMAGILSRTAAASLRTTAFMALTTTSAWAGLAASQTLLGRKLALQPRLWLIGAGSGLWAFIDQINGRPRFLYSIRLALLSQYNLLRKQRQGRPLFNGDAAALFSASLVMTFVLYNIAPISIASPAIRKLCSWLQTGEWVDCAPVDVDEGDKST